MKCVCDRDCQVRLDDGKIKWFRKGDVDGFSKCPPHFTSLEAKKIDFATAGEQELMEAEYDLDALKKFIEDKYARKAGARGKEKTVEMLMDCRFRELTIDPNMMV